MNARILLVLLAAVPAGFVLAGSAKATLLTLETRQTAVATICGGTPCIGANEMRVSNSSVGGVSHSNVLAGTLLTPSEARTAARSGPLEIAANATLRHGETGPFVNYPEVNRSFRVYRSGGMPWSSWACGYPR